MFRLKVVLTYFDTERTAKDILNSSDDVIAQYAGAFQQLKERFDARSRLSALKVLRDVSQGVVQLSDILDDMRDMGEHPIRIQRECLTLALMSNPCRRANENIGKYTRP
jgi:hypothetical protein